MENLNTLLQKRFTHAIKKSFANKLTDNEAEADIAPCLQDDFGHYQCNSALRLSKILKTPPKDLAEQIIMNLEHKTADGEEMISSLSIAGPGFININLNPQFLSQQLQQSAFSPHLGAHIPEKKEKIVVEFSSPNVAKELHVGHLRSTIIGECLARLFEFLGHDVLRLNHIGDWGTQFGMLIAYLKQFSPKVLAGEEQTDLSTLMSWYQASKKLFDSDATFRKKSQEEVVQLQSLEKSSLHAWEMICNISRKAFEEIYQLLDVTIIERGESSYNKDLPLVVSDLEKKGLITLSDGAKCLYLEGYENREGNPLPLIVQKSDGGYNYDSTEITAFRQRVSEEKADRIIIVTDAGQKLHFQMVYDAVVKAGWLDPEKTRFDHVTFGLVLGPDGKKFKTREGKTEKLIDLLLEAVNHAKKILSERLPCVDPQEIEELSKILGIGAVKYADLSCHRQKDYRFSYDRMLRFEGNTIAFLEYAYVRIEGIKRKSQMVTPSLIHDHPIHLKHPSEIALGLHLRRFGEVLDMLAKDLLPNRLTDYLYELAEKFNAFFRDCRVIGSPEEGPRLSLCDLTARILKEGLFILGIKTMNRM